jgi:ribosomal protein S18 acetylase RimI-like enzyme
MQHAVAYALETRASRLMLGVYAGNERARAFYRKQGFTRISDRLFRLGIVPTTT